MGTIFVDATHAAKTGARTGTQTVVRGLLWDCVSIVLISK
jgi:hypothetical protein